MRETLRRRAAVLLGAALLACTVPALTATPASAVTAVALEVGQRLDPGHDLTHDGSRLVMQWDGNLVLYLVNDQGATGPVLWSSGTYGNWGAYASMQADGNFVVYDASDRALWQSGTYGHPGVKVQMLGGTVAIWGGPGFLWQTETERNNNFGRYSGLGPGQYAQSNSVWLLMQKDGNLVMYRKRDGAVLWSTGTYGHPGSVAIPLSGSGEFIVSEPKRGRIWTNGVTVVTDATTKLQDDGNLVVYDGSGRALWASGTYGNW